MSPTVRNESDFCFTVISGALYKSEWLCENFVKCSIFLLFYGRNFDSSSCFYVISMLDILLPICFYVNLPFHCFRVMQMFCYLCCTSWWISEVRLVLKTYLPLHSSVSLVNHFHHQLQFKDNIYCHTFFCVTVLSPLIIVFMLKPYCIRAVYCRFIYFLPCHFKTKWLWWIICLLLWLSLCSAMEWNRPSCTISFSEDLPRRSPWCAALNLHSTPCDLHFVFNNYHIFVWLKVCEWGLVCICVELLFLFLLLKFLSVSFT